MTPTQAFFTFLHTLSQTPTQAYASADGTLQHAVYGGNALQAFLVALWDHVQFVWLDAIG